MAYAAGLGESAPAYFDTVCDDGPLAHPLFPVCWEWPLVLELRSAAGLEAIYPRVVHAEHDLTWHRRPRAGETLSVSARVVSVEARRPGAFMVARLDAAESGGALVATTRMGSLYRGVALEGESGALEPVEPLALTDAALEEVAQIEVAANAAHVYTECARIWNPIHTDLAHARKAGLPGLILHGTATLALSVSRALDAFGIAPDKARRIACRFSGMVPMPSTLTLLARRDAQVIAFETRDANGSPVVSRGAIQIL